MVGTILKSGLGALLAALASAPAWGAGAVAPARATMLSPLAAVSTQDLDFGTILPGIAAGTVTINPNSGNATAAGGATLAGGTPQRAEFTAVGQNNILAISTLGPSPVLTNGTGGTMATTLTMGGGLLGIFNFPGSGIRKFRVGGTLSVGASQPDGLYTGTFTLTVIYF